ncbi:MAG: hypothetical protein ACOH5I_22610 [Oligoflexus sp.]
MMQTEPLDLSDKLTRLKQGSIVNLEKAKFTIEKPDKSKEDVGFFHFYREVTECKWGVVLNQDCDLAHEGKIDYLSIGLLEPFSRNPLRYATSPEEVENIGAAAFVTFDDRTYWSRETLVGRLEKVFKNLIKNIRTHQIFLSLKEKCENCQHATVDEFYVVNLTKIFPIRAVHYNSLLKNCEHMVTNGFDYLLGWKLAHMYGRVGVDEYSPDQVKTIIQRNIHHLTGAFSSKLGVDEIHETENVNGLKKLLRKLEIHQEKIDAIEKDNPADKSDKLMKESQKVGQVLKEIQSLLEKNN